MDRNGTDSFQRAEANKIAWVFWKLLQKPKGNYGQNEKKSMRMVSPEGINENQNHNYIRLFQFLFLKILLLIVFDAWLALDMISHAKFSCFAFVMRCLYKSGKRKGGGEQNGKVI